MLFLVRCGLVAYSLLFTTLVSSIVNAFPNRKLLGYSYFDQLRDMVPQICLSCVMGVVVYCIQFLGLRDIVTLIIQVVVGAVIYISGSKLLKLESFEYIWKMLMGILKRRG